MESRGGAGVSRARRMKSFQSALPLLWEDCDNKDPVARGGRENRVDASEEAEPGMRVPADETRPPGLGGPVGTIPSAVEDGLDFVLA